jgi:hypothetical protein
VSIITRSTIPIPAIIRLAMWRWRATLNRPAQDAKAAEAVRHVR